MEQNSNDKFNDLQRDIVEIKKEIIAVDNRVAKAESNRDLPPHQTQSVKEDDDRGPRLTEKEVGKLLPPLSEWKSMKKFLSAALVP
ncbi:hypothetical protein H4Q26_013279 [Puccinia striiformis f. sp. tritici PST-130]|nr:hypothetical protein H4Q26_013279 [Puccinia striiformis f. sp. tritici PST-130]